MTPLLLDTHALLWSVGDEDRLSPATHEMLSAGVVPAYVSAASIWEIAIKRASGKLDAPEDLLDKVAAARFIELGITFAHASHGANLLRPSSSLIVASPSSRSPSSSAITPRTILWLSSDSP